MWRDASACESQELKIYRYNANYNNNNACGCNTCVTLNNLSISKCTRVVPPQRYKYIICHRHTKWSPASISPAWVPHPSRVSPFALIFLLSYNQCAQLTFNTTRYIYTHIVVCALHHICIILYTRNAKLYTRLNVPQARIAISNKKLLY